MFSQDYVIFFRFNNVITRSASSLQGRDLQLSRLQENIIQIDKSDSVIGPVTKKNGHLMTNIQNGRLTVPRKMIFLSKRELIPDTPIIIIIIIIIPTRGFHSNQDYSLGMWLLQTNSLLGQNDCVLVCLTGFPSLPPNTPLAFGFTCFSKKDVDLASGSQPPGSVECRLQMALLFSSVPYIR